MCSVASQFRAVCDRCLLWVAVGLAREHAADLDFGHVASAGRCRLSKEAAKMQCLVSQTARLAGHRFCLAAESASLHRPASSPAWLVRPRCFVRGCSRACSRPHGCAAPFVTEGGVARISYYTRSSAVLLVLTRCMGPGLARVSSPEFYLSKKAVISSHARCVCPTRAVTAVTVVGGGTATSRSAANKDHVGP